MDKEKRKMRAAENKGQGHKKLNVVSLQEQ